MLEFEKNLKFEQQIYKKGYVFKCVNMAYFKLNVDNFYKRGDVEKFIKLALKDKNEGLKLSEIELFIELLTDQELFYNILRDICLNEWGFIC